MQRYILVGHEGFDGVLSPEGPERIVGHAWTMSLSGLCSWPPRGTCRGIEYAPMRWYAKAPAWGTGRAGNTRALYANGVPSVPATAHNWCTPQPQGSEKKATESQAIVILARRADPHSSESFIRVTEKTCRMWGRKPAKAKLSQAAPGAVWERITAAGARACLGGGAGDRHELAFRDSGGADWLTKDLQRDLAMESSRTSRM